MKRTLLARSAVPGDRDKRKCKDASVPDADAGRCNERKHGGATFLEKHADPRLPADVRVGAHRVLPRFLFLQQLQRDKQLAERSNAALSVLLFDFQDATGDRLEGANALLDVLNQCKRETDVIGVLGGGLVAALLPETNGDGARCFVDKVIRNLGPCPVATSIATYPDNVFDELLQLQRAPGPAEGGLLFNDLAEPGRFARWTRRAIDIAVAFIAIVSLSPLMLLTAVAIAARSPGLILHKQVRLGKGGVPFVSYTFRTMYCHLDEMTDREYLASLIATGELPSEVPTCAGARLTDDWRITPLGRVLAETSINELPQLFNLLKGDVSLVGPLRATPHKADHYHAGRCAVSSP
jgi:lipopolysaccharide/colanic/teichoic acid biosynthesis glycosyltransferase